MKSRVYGFVYERAEAITTSAKKKFVSMESLLLGAFQFLNDFSKDQLSAKESITDQDREEIKKAMTVLQSAHIHTDTKYQSLYEVYAAAQDSLYSWLFVNTMESELDSNGTITLDAVLDFILKKPTDNIKKTLFDGNVSESDSKPDAETVHEKIGDLNEPIPSNINFRDLLNMLSNGSEKKDVFPGKKDDLIHIPDDIVVNKPDDTKEADGNNATPTEPVNKIEQLKNIVSNIKNIRNELANAVYGQDYAINAFVSGYFQSEVMALSPNRKDQPRSIFLFAGPPGVGKTYLAQTAAAALKIPFCRFDMSEYSDKEANLMFAGFDKAYKDSHAGAVTGFVKKNPHCLLLFDEIEKSHVKVKNLFLQIMDVGRVRDNYYDKEISFKDCIIIFTTNVGRMLYEDDSISNLSLLSRKVILKALAEDIDPNLNEPSFPKAICSRFASGNVIMFNHLTANYLLRIVNKELKEQITDITGGTEVAITFDDYLPYLLIYSEGGKADARAMRGKGRKFIYEELYELFNLMASETDSMNIDDLKEIHFNVDLPDNAKIKSLFMRNEKAKVLVFASKEVASELEGKVKSAMIYATSDLKEAKKILASQPISLILCDLRCKVKKGRENVLNIEDVDSLGRDFFNYVLEFIATPIYVLTQNEGDISEEENVSLTQDGARGIVYLASSNENYQIDQVIGSECDKVYQQESLLRLAKENKVISYRSSQEVSSDGTAATITLFDLDLSTAVDAGDTDDVLNGVSKPNVHFSDVIGAEDAKEELSYFVEYLKNPTKFMYQGVKAPKGVLLYGPPGTGKTLLAKAMAGESEVTFVRAEGNQFLKKWVGEGAESVHKIFAVARKYAPSILFIDEIDAIGKERGNNLSDNTSDVLTSFLTEMDGFNTNSNKPVFVLAATNYSIESGTTRSLDAALMRRFDRKILIDLPNKQERIQYIQMKMGRNRNIKLSEEQIDNIAIRSTGTSLAELDSIFELALRDAIRSKGGIVDDAILEEAFESYNSGEVKQWDSSELQRTARHEAGHAVMCWLGGEMPSYLTIVARGSHGGYMQHAVKENKGTYTKEELLASVRTALGGRASEVVYYGDKDGISTGASGDLQTATNIIEAMICTYGMDEEIGLGTFNSQFMNSPYYGTIRSRISTILKEEFTKTIEALKNHKAVIDELVLELLEKNHLKGNEIAEILNKYKA